MMDILWITFARLLGGFVVLISRSRLDLGRHRTRSFLAAMQECPLPSEVQFSGSGLSLSQLRPAWVPSASTHLQQRGRSQETLLTMSRGNTALGEALYHLADHCCLTGVRGSLSSMKLCMKLTEGDLTRARSVRGGWNREQLEILGVPWPPPHGWQAKVIGKEITPSSLARLIELRGETKRERKPKRSVVKSDLPIPPGFPVKAETVLASFHLYLTRAPVELLKIMLPVLEYIVRTARKRAGH